MKCNYFLNSVCGYLTIQGLSLSQATITQCITVKSTVSLKSYFYLYYHLDEQHSPPKFPNLEIPPSNFLSYTSHIYLFTKCYLFHPNSLFIKKSILLNSTDSVLGHHFLPQLREYAPTVMLFSLICFVVTTTPSAYPKS